MQTEKFVLANNETGYYFRVENVSRQEIHTIIDTISEIYLNRDKSKAFLILIDASDPSIVLTDYIKQTIQTRFPADMLMLFNGGIAIVLQATPVALSLQIFLKKILRRTATPHYYQIFTNLDNAKKWLFEQAKTHVEGFSYSVPSALVIEDDPRINNLFVKLLMKEEYKYRTVSRGDHALETLQSYYPHIILLDIFLPGANGFQVLDFIGEMPNLKNTTVITVSASVTVFETLDLGAHYAFQKPVSPRELIKILTKIKSEIS